MCYFKILVAVNDAKYLISVLPSNSRRSELFHFRKKNPRLFFAPYAVDLLITLKVRMRWPLGHTKSKKILSEPKRCSNPLSPICEVYLFRVSWVYSRAFEWRHCPYFGWFADMFCSLSSQTGCFREIRPKWCQFVGQLQRRLSTGTTRLNRIYSLFCPLSSPNFCHQITLRFYFSISVSI